MNETLDSAEVSLMLMTPCRWTDRTGGGQVKDRWRTGGGQVNVVKLTLKEKHRAEEEKSQVMSQMLSQVMSLVSVQVRRMKLH